MDQQARQRGGRSLNSNASRLIRLDGLRTPKEIAALERAFMRMLEGVWPALQGAAVREHNGHLQIWMDFAGSVEGARRRAENAFSKAWYDAFGELGSAHVGWVLEGLIPLPQAAADGERQRATDGGSR